MNILLKLLVLTPIFIVSSPVLLLITFFKPDLVNKILQTNLSKQQLIGGLGAIFSLLIFANVNNSTSTPLVSNSTKINEFAEEVIENTDSSVQAQTETQKLAPQPTSTSQDNPETIQLTISPTSEVVISIMPTILLANTPNPTQTPTKNPTSAPSPVPSQRPTATPRPTALPTIAPSRVPTAVYFVAPTTNPSNGGGFSCNCSKTCPNMISCAEAQYQLNICGCSARDGDNDGIACDADCQ